MNRINKTISFGLLLGHSILSNSVAADKIYKWTDANGQAHYSTKKPENRNAKEVNIRVPKTQPLLTKKDNETIPEATVSERFDKMRKRKEDYNKKASKKKENCQKARATSARFKKQIRFSHTAGDGKTTYLDDSQREEIIIAANKAIKTYCN